MNDWSSTTTCSYGNVLVSSVPVVASSTCVTLYSPALLDLSSVDYSSTTSGLSSTTPFWTQDAGDLKFGLAILITLVALLFMGLLFNSTRLRRHG